MKASKQYHKMQGLAATRLRLGISQQAMALELGISNSFLSRIENGERIIPAAALAKLSALEITIAAAATVQPLQAVQGETWSTAEKESFARAALDKGERCRQKAAKLQLDLDIMTTRYNQLCESLNKIASLISQPAANGEAAPGRASHLEKHRDAMAAKLGRYGRFAQTALRHKIALLYAEADLHTMDAYSFGR
ncbi:MAG: helix-turn-helix transcriptional regulator [Rhizobacter sp.]|nr:helix-turn-helix transcriptional regulator [Ferruginibacter sp.]